MATQTPLMGLYLPTAGVDTGQTWEADINQNSSVIDGHNHSPGFGNIINPSGININSDLPINANNLTTVRTTRYVEEASIPASSPDIGCTYVSGVDLYYNDLNGNVIQVTKSGGINATSSGIVNGTASASFASSILVVYAASNTPASIKAGSLLIGNTGTTGSYYITLGPNGTLGSNYSLQLPAVSPSGTQLLSIDTSGNMAPTATVSSTIANNIGTEMTSTGANAVGATMTSTGANAVAATRTRASGSSTEGAGGIAISSSCGVAYTSSTSFTNITNLSVTLTTSGRPVQVMIMGDGSGNASQWYTTNGNYIGYFQVVNSTSSVNLAVVGTLAGNVLPGGTPFYSGIDTSVGGSAGTYTYVVKFKIANSSAACYFAWCKLVAYEL